MARNKGYGIMKIVSGELTTHKGDELETEFNKIKIDIGIVPNEGVKLIIIIKPCYLFYSGVDQNRSS